MHNIAQLAVEEDQMVFDYTQEEDWPAKMVTACNIVLKTVINDEGLAKTDILLKT